MTATARPRAAVRLHPVPTLPGVFVAPSRSEPGVHHVVSGGAPFWVCSCYAGDRDNPCEHTIAANELAEEELHNVTAAEKSTAVVLAERSSVVVRATEQQLKVAAEMEAWKGYLWMATQFPPVMLPAAVKTPEMAAMIMLKASHLDIPVTEAFEYIDVIEGRVNLRAQMIRALVDRSGKGQINVLESSAERCVCEGVRPGFPRLRVTYTIEDAAKARLLDKDNWKKHPADMLVARASSRVGRRLFPDVLSGMALVADGELVDAIEAPMAPAADERVIEGEFSEVGHERAEADPVSVPVRDAGEHEPGLHAGVVGADGPQRATEEAQPALMAEGGPVFPEPKWDEVRAGAGDKGLGQKAVARAVGIKGDFTEAELRAAVLASPYEAGRILGLAADWKAAQG